MDGLMNFFNTIIQHISRWSSLCCRGKGPYYLFSVFSIWIKWWGCYLVVDILSMSILVALIHRVLRNCESYGLYIVVGLTVKLILIFICMSFQIVTDWIFNDDLSCTHWLIAIAVVISSIWILVIFHMYCFCLICGFNICHNSKRKSFICCLEHLVLPYYAFILIYEYI